MMPGLRRREIVEHRNPNLAELFPAAYNKSPERRSKSLPSLGNPSGVPLLPARACAVLALELRGLRKTEIAVQLNLKETAVHYITRTDRYMAARKVMLDRLDGEFLAMKPAVLDALRRGLDSADDNVAVRASEVWMRATGFMQYGKGEASSIITAEDVVRRLLTVAVNVNVDASSS